MGKKKTSASTAGPASTPFQFSGGFNAGAANPGESALSNSAGKKGKKVEEEEDEDEEEDDEEDEEDDEDGEGLLLDLNDLPKSVANRVHALKKLQENADSIDDEYKQERQALEKKYIARRQELYESRRQIVNGEVEVPDVPREEGEGEATEAEDEAPVVGIPQFWPTVLSVHPAINEYITEDDIPVLEKITDVTVAYADDFTSFTLSFHFAENEFFSNAVLTKKYEVVPDLLDDQSPTLKSTEGCEIAWKAGKNLIEEEITKKQRAKSGRNKGQVRTITIKKPKRSFFHFFYPVTGNVDEAEEDDEDEEEKAPKDEPVDKDGNPVKIDPESDYDIGHTIRTSLIPEAVNWFTGEAALEYDQLYGGYDDDEDDEEEDDEDDEEDEEEEEEEEAPKKGKGGKKGPAPKKGKGGEEQPAECKQN